MESNPVLPDFTRWQWASLDERAWWSPLFRDASIAFQEVERLSVVEGIRPAAWQNVNSTGLIEASQWAHSHGLIVVPTNTTGSSGNYSTTESAGTDTIRIVYVRPEHYAKVLPWRDNQKIGELLGFPKCCRQAFDATWGAGQVDSTFEQFVHSRPHMDGLVHTLFRWMGLRTVPHMPCSHNCEESTQFAEKLLDIGVKSGYVEEMQLLKDVQRWPVKWSRLFGLAELTSSALKITTRSDWTATLQEFTKPGTYNRPHATLWTDNGYNDPQTMRDAHTTLLHTLKDELPQNARITDLGCGNGLLLKRLKMHRPDVRISGIDINTKAIQRAGLGSWKTGTIQSGIWEQWKPDAVLITPGRLTEMTQGDAEFTHRGLSRVPRVFLYSYADTLTKGTLDVLAAQAGFPKIHAFTQSPLVSVGLVTKD